MQELVAFLRAESFDVWVDQEVPTGDRWDLIVRDKLDTCGALVVVVMMMMMSPLAEESPWVGAEVDRAHKRHKPILPMLLEASRSSGWAASNMRT